MSREAVVYQRCSIILVCPIGDFRDSVRKEEGQRETETSGYGPIDREIERYDIIVTNTESILYYCTSASL